MKFNSAKQTMWQYTLLLLISGVLSETVTRYTNLECKILDPSYGDIVRCDLKMLGRGIVGLNVHAKLLKSFDNAKVNLSLWRKYNGYRPFMFNKTFDFCKLMAQSNRKLSFEKIYVESIAKNSNINHSCPYDHDLIVRDMVFLEEHYKFLPLPTGEYMIKLIGATNNNWKIETKTYLSRQEDLI